MSRRLLVLLAIPVAAFAAGTTLTAGAAPAVVTHECKGLRVCVKVAGPWVVVPAGQSVPRRPVEFQLSCPKGYIVGGLDAELSDRAIDVFFLGKLGSPVNPGVTTSGAAVFTATYVGTSARAPSFRPHLGCMPSSGGGRIQTAVTYPVGSPTVRHVKTVRVLQGSHQVAASCAKRERLISASHALGFFGAKPPEESLVASLTGGQAVAGGRVTASVQARPLVNLVRAIVQVDAVCARIG